MKIDKILVNNLSENRYFNCEKVFIRGSYALKTSNQYSDLDILVVSNDFVGLDIITRKRLLHKSFDVDLELKLDPICLTLDEFMYVCNDSINSSSNEELYEVII